MNLKHKFSVDSKQVVSRVIDKEVIVLNLDTGHYFTLNESGTIIWDTILAGKDLGQALKNLKDRFPEKGDAVLQKDISDFIQELEKEKLICKQK